MPRVRTISFANCHPGSAARKKLRPGDRITAVNGLPVGRVAELQDAIGRYYAGDEVTLSIRRGAKPIEHRLTLVAELPPYARPLLGILPRRDKASSGEVTGVNLRRPLDDNAFAFLKL